MANKNTNIPSSSKNHSSWLGLADSYSHAISPQLPFSNNESSTREGDVGKNLRDMTPPPHNNRDSVVKEMPMRDRHFLRASSSSSMIDDITHNISQNPLFKINPIPSPKQPFSDSFHPTLISVSSKSQLPHENETTILSINPSIGLCLQQIKNPVIATTIGDSASGKNPVIATTVAEQVCKIHNNGDSASGDVQIRSVPYKKNGPYTCSRCNRVFSTSQSFAAHASSHYKHETKDEKEKRVSSKFRKRGIRPQTESNEITFVPASSQDHAAAGGVARTAGAEVDQDRATLPSTAHGEGVNVRLEPKDV